MPRPANDELALCHGCYAMKKHVHRIHNCICNGTAVNVDLCPLCRKRRKYEEKKVLLSLL